MTRAVILVEQGFQDEEFIYPYYRMQEEGWLVDVAVPDTTKQYFGKYGVPARATINIGALRAYDYDLVVVPGGFECPDRLRMRLDVRAFILLMCKTNRVIAAICHGPWVLISAGIMLGIKCTGYESIKDDLQNAGALYIKAPVIRHENIITADHYKNNGQFMHAVIGCIREKEYMHRLTREYQSPDAKVVDAEFPEIGDARFEGEKNDKQS